jgi:hypothetical protein
MLSLLSRLTPPPVRPAVLALFCFTISAAPARAVELPDDLRLAQRADEQAAELAPLYLQVAVNPADKAKEADAASRTTPDPLAPWGGEGPKRTPSYELPAVDVTGKAGSDLVEEDRVGPYAQPRWTARRRFPGTRVYVRPPGTVEFEYWNRTTLDDGETEMRQLWELSIGFEPRLQLDLYFRTDHDGDDSEWLVGTQVEMRYALADWGQIRGNPTIYVEWVGLEQRADKIELKLLLGDELAPRWHWGVNAVAELELSGEREYEYQLTGGLSYTVTDSKFSVGAEFQAITANVKGDRGDWSDPTVFVGPSFQVAPLPQFHIDFAPMVGVTSGSPEFRAFLVVGWEF